MVGTGQGMLEEPRQVGKEGRMGGIHRGRETAQSGVLFVTKPQISS